MSRAEVDLQISVKKACNPDETPPKRKHVRACIVYTWDHKNSRAFWNAVKVQPLQSSEVQLFKALIMIHKVLQEGHPNTLKDGYRNKDFLYSLSTVFPSSSSYGRLINQYDRFLLRKLDFHRGNVGFNGTFEYEEYISLKTVNDPNEGYDSILQLMDLQDLINELQKLIFSTIHHSPNNLCKVSALVPLITESYGIYKFLISMLRAMYQQLGEDEILVSLFDRFHSQHFVLRDFYTDCQAIKFLTSLITIPRLASNVPNLMVTDDEQPFTKAPSENPSQLSLQNTSGPDSSFPPPEDTFSQPQSTQSDHFLAMQQQQQQLEIQRQQQIENSIQQQRMFEDQRQLQEQRMLAEQASIREQQSRASALRVSELEQDLLMFKNQFDNDQTLLQQYDSRVKSLETELATINETATQQLAAKDQQFGDLEELVNNWAKKYESLAKLYSQLRLEHLNLLSKFKKIQQKISSAQESIAKKEKLEKDLKAKNLELADLIRERDRARLDLDRAKAAKDVEVDKLATRLRELEANSVDHQKSLETKHQEALANLRKEAVGSSAETLENLRQLLKDKEMDLSITQESLDETLLELHALQNQSNPMNFAGLIDIILTNNVRRVQESKYEFTSPVQSGNSGATPDFVAALVDLCSNTATEFAQSFNEFVVEGKELSSTGTNESYTKIVLSSSELVASVHDLMLNCKGLSANLSIHESDTFSTEVSELLSAATTFFLSLTSDIMAELEDDDEKINHVIDCNVSFQHHLQVIFQIADSLGVSVSNSSLKVEDAVDHELELTAKAVESASKLLAKLQMSIVNSEDIEVSESLIAAVIRITETVKLLVASAFEAQKEIVERNKGNSSGREFYRKNSRWTEGLVSAAKAIAGATNVLIRTADGVVNSKNEREQLMVASKEVAASTAQLVAAARVKANFVSHKLQRLETDSSEVSGACKALVRLVQLLVSDHAGGTGLQDLSSLTTYEGKALEMEQQVEILKLENTLALARRKLGEIRKYGYKDAAFDEE